jgi:putative transposase
LTEAVRIVARVTEEVRVSASGVYDLGYHIVWCPQYRSGVLAGRVAARCEGLIRAKASGHGWPIVALGVVPDHVHLFVKAHRSSSPSRIASQLKGFTSRRLVAGFPHLRSRLPTLWSRPYFAATAYAVSAETVRGYFGTHDGRPWRQERAR